MPRESKKAKRERAVAFCAAMDALYGTPEPALHFASPFECVVCVALSAQTTDANVNRVTPELFRRYPNAQAMAAARVEDVEEIIHSLGLYHSKAKNCVACAQMLVAEFAGEVPATMEELRRLPGVGRKTANIVLNHCFGIVEGIAVDTHVKRISQRLRFTCQADPSKIEADLLALLPRELWRDVNAQWILFGRQWCTARSPKCASCPVNGLCPSFR